MIPASAKSRPASRKAKPEIKDKFITSGDFGQDREEFGKMEAIRWGRKKSAREPSKKP
jgi:hypothetical protein